MECQLCGVQSLPICSCFLVIGVSFWGIFWLLYWKADWLTTILYIQLPKNNIELLWGHSDAPCEGMVLNFLCFQFAFNTLQRVNPVSHGVCNVVKRIVIIGTSVLFFGNVLTKQTMMGTGVALIGTYLYVEATKRFGSSPPKEPPTPTASSAAAK